MVDWEFLADCCDYVTAFRELVLIQLQLQKEYEVASWALLACRGMLWDAVGCGGITFFPPVVAKA